VADDTAAIQAALNAELYVSFGRGKTYKTSSSLTLRNGHVLDLNSATIKPTTSASYTVFSWIGSGVGPVELNVDGAEFANQITLVASGVSTLGLVVGDWVLINEDDGRAQVSQVLAITSQTLTLADPLYWRYTTLKNAYVNRYAPSSFGTIIIRGGTIDGSGNTGVDTHGIALHVARNCLVEDMNLINLTGAGLWMDTGHGNIARSIRVKKCGNGSFADVSFGRQTKSTIDNISSEQSTGFGPALGSLANCQISNVNIVHDTVAAGRGFKLQRSAACQISNIAVHGNGSPYTGFGMVWTRRCVANNVHVYSIGAAGGAWLVEMEHCIINNLYTYGGNPSITLSGGYGNYVNGDYDVTQLAANNSDSGTPVYRNGRRLMAHSSERTITEQAIKSGAWGTQINSTDNSWIDVCWSPELALFVAIAFSGTGTRVMTSPDGATWTTRTSAADNTWVTVCWAPSLLLFVAVSQDGTNRVMTSPDGITWTSRSAAAANTWNGVCWSPELSLFVAVAQSGSGNRVMTSPDGINWTSRTSAADNEWRRVVWVPELRLFVAVATSGTGNRVMTSPDGINWSIQTSAADNQWIGLCWSPELQLLVATAVTGTGNRVMTSPNGFVWTSRTSAADNEWRDVEWSPDLQVFLAVAATGTGNRIMSSYDGISWTTRTSAADNDWRGVCWSPDRQIFVAVGSTGTLTRVMTNTKTPPGTATLITESLQATKHLNNEAFIKVQNSFVGTGAVARLQMASDIATLQFQAHSSGRTVTRFGVTIGGWTELLGAVAGNGLLIGTFGNTPVIMGVNSAEVMRMDLTSSLQIGGSAARAGTAGTRRLDIFDGTAPTSTLANGISLYSTSGELRVMDAAGNATLLSPHDDAGRWVYDSVDTVTGRRLRVDMEQLVKALEAHFGWGFVHESEAN
jgi:hypothetical protein